jgi:hypothetical protein
MEFNFGLEEKTFAGFHHNFISRVPPCPHKELFSQKFFNAEQE